MPRTGFRSSALMLGLAVALLAATAVYLVARDRYQVWNAAHENQQDLAISIQSSISGLLAPPVASLQGIRSDLDALSTSSEPAIVSVLRDAQRFDPISSYLGITDEAGTLLIGAQGVSRTSLPDEIRANAAAGPRPGSPPRGIRFGRLLQIEGDPNWYLPLELDARASGTDGVLFALVPATRLLSASASLKVLPDSFVTLFTKDGARLLRYTKSTDVIEPNGKRVPPSALQRMAEAPSGSFASKSTVDGRATIFGYSSFPDLPLVVSTGVPESALTAQWLSKSMAPAAVLIAGLAALLVFGLRLRRSIREHGAYAASQEYVARHDQLTGLPNRYAFLQFVDHLIANATDRSTFCVLLLDLNRFKDVNDTLGHAAGDEVLQVLGRRMRESLTGTPVCIARLGGDELAICVATLDATQTEAVAAFCDRVQATLNAPLVASGVELALTASIGVAAYPVDAKTSTGLLRCADIAMYESKAGLTPFSKYSELMDHFTSDALAMRAELSKAIREQTLTLVYQPKLRLEDRALIGVEALARWVHPTKGPIPPIKFIPLAETTELIHPFTEFVLRTAVSQVARWMSMGVELPVAVNISANNLLDPGFADKLRLLLRETGVPAHLIELEVTENALMRSPDVMLKRLHEIREIGVRMSIDDFGTGFASLAYLKRLPVDTLKIDKTFITNADSDEGDLRIVKSSIQLAHGFGLKVVAEGVETELVAQMLLDNGCDAAQGFHFSKPVVCTEIESTWFARLAVAATW